MILDAYAELASSQAVTSSAYTTYSYDLTGPTPKRNVGAGEPLALLFTVDVAAATSDDTIDLQIVTSANANLTSDIDLASWRIAGASLTAGSKWVIPFPKGNNLYKRYVGGRVEVGTGDSLTISAYIIPLSDAESLETFADGVTFDA